ncbi:hypothetical protein [Corynebacterium terpenotabidum]|uniref:Uncharacterized protein n=1 Tax=Corynebacterium terpenotabidum Y-11 TaxID=1200352 RepID=S4XHK3_9CORY|nr:hypothetical protein [Corynebacterium terpenotabidum]AGP30123.1 hypothetical protein A606_02350 [Corynebacterium terpenotabidum Y-11]
MITLTITDADGSATTYRGDGAGIRVEALVDLVTVEEGVTTYDLTDDQKQAVESYVEAGGLQEQAAADWDDAVRDFVITTRTLEDLGRFLGGPGSTVTITD